MPLVEVVPTASTAVTPGWAYVPDTGYDPSKEAIVPSGARKRARISHYVSSPANTAGASVNDQASARQQAKIAKHLVELDKENHKDVQIVFPHRTKDLAQRGTRGKMTTGVKKIVLSAKTWKNYLDDEEASLAQQKPTAATTRQNIQVEAMELDSPSSIEPDQISTPAVTILDANTAALINVDVPSFPSRAELEALLSSPPLSYNASRAASSTSTAPPRLFCEMCGYWGRARCMKCGTRVCGLECKRQHDDTRCLRFYA